MEFLDTMDRVIPREKLVNMINESILDRVDELWWRPRIATEKKIRMYFLSQWFNLSDILTEEWIYDRLSFQYFMDIDATVDQIPDSTTLCDFRLFLETSNLWKKILEIVNELLKEAEIMMMGWTLIDATIIKAPSSTKNQNNERDPEMTSTKKRGNWSFWAKSHIATDTNWLIHDLQVTTAKIHDSQVYDEIVPDKSDYSIWDSAYDWDPLQKIAQEKWVVHVAMKKKEKWQKVLSICHRLWNTLLAMPRKVVEFPFWVIKHLWWHRKTRYRWLKKLKSQRYVLAALCNIYRSRKKLIRRWWY